MSNRGWLWPVSALTALLGLATLVTAGTELARDRSTPSDFGTTRAWSAAVRSSPPSTTHPPSRFQPAPAAPAALAIPALGVRASVVAISDTGGVLNVPTDPAQVGWWSASALPGAPAGTVVIDGHVDSAAAGPGALFQLADLRPGSMVVLTATTGERRGYLVVGRRIYPKTSGLPADLFVTDGPPRLVLITCGGPFDHALGSYLDNVVVFATPSPEASDATKLREP